VSRYDFILAGGGAAGLGLAYALTNSSLRGRRLLLIDRDAKERNDRTWCFWTDRPTPFDHLISHTWERAEIVAPHWQGRFELAPYRYQMIRGLDFYQGLRAALAQTPGVELRQARVSAIHEATDRSEAQVLAGGEALRARWVFDSAFVPSDFASGPPGYHYLRQHFKGWEIETPTDCFDPNTVTLFDFRTPQKGSLRFMYLLPFTPRRALVEYTLFSASLLKSAEYDNAIAAYLEGVRGIRDYRVTGTESGVIPMTDRPFARRPLPHVMTIGTKGGLVKPSSGYAFLRIQADAQAIVASLEQHGHPFGVPEPPARYRFFDRLMLQVLYRQGDQAAAVFTRLFQRNSIQAVFRFLDERATLAENLRLIASLPKAPFLRALLRTAVLRQV
jgi:lycopene beta-cyclase